MENAAEALMFVFGVVVFILALTLLFQTASLAKVTAETLITEADRTTYYTYSGESSSIIPSIHGKNKDVTVLNRIVTLEDMIPTIYRYTIESYGVTIIDKNGNIVARYEGETENLCNNIDRVSNDTVESLIEEINTYVLKPVEAKEIKDKAELIEVFRKVYAQIPNINMGYYDYECAWRGQDALIAQRIDSDLSRNNSLF